MVLREASYRKNTVVLIFRHIQCLQLMNSELACVLVSSGTQVQPKKCSIQITFQTIFPFLMTMVFGKLSEFLSFSDVDNFDDFLVSLIQI